jgi:phosphatidylglycerophosphate synthase
LRDDLITFFTPKEIENAKAYKYNGTDESIAARLFLRRYWNWAIEFVPMWVAPNLITFIGFLFEAASFLISFVLSRGLALPLPRWACVCNGLCLFIYQTFDNLDGRQARRTHSSSAIGQFFDHGCDALTGVFELVKSAATANLGTSSTTFWFVFIIGICFSLTSYEEYVTGAFYLGPVNGPDEGLFALAIAQVVVGVSPSLRFLFVNWFQYAVVLLVSAFGVGLIAINVIKQCRSDRTKRSRAALGVVAPLFSIGLTVLNVVRNSEITHSVYFTMVAGFVLQYWAQQIIIAHLVMRGPVTLLMDWAGFSFWLFVAILILYPLAEYFETYWQSVLAVLLAIILVTDVRVVLGLSGGLGVPVFTLRKAPVLEEVPVVADTEKSDGQQFGDVATNG